MGAATEIALCRSVDEKQRAVAAHCLMSWCMEKKFAREAWLHGSEPLVDLLMEDPKVKAWLLPRAPPRSMSNCIQFPGWRRIKHRHELSR